MNRNPKIRYGSEKEKPSIEIFSVTAPINITTTPAIIKAIPNTIMRDVPLPISIHLTTLFGNTLKPFWVFISIGNNPDNFNNIQNNKQHATPVLHHGGHQLHDFDRGGSSNNKDGVFFDGINCGNNWYSHNYRIWNLQKETPSSILYDYSREKCERWVYCHHYNQCLIEVYSPLNACAVFGKNISIIADASIIHGRYFSWFTIIPIATSINPSRLPDAIASKYAITREITVINAKISNAIAMIPAICSSIFLRDTNISICSSIKVLSTFGILQEVFLRDTHYFFWGIPPNFCEHGCWEEKQNPHYASSQHLNHCVLTMQSNFFKGNYNPSYDLYTSVNTFILCEVKMRKNVKCLYTMN